MKFILCMVLIFLFGFIGYGIAGFYITRKKFFFSLNQILIKFKSDISFSLKKIIDLIDESIVQVQDKNLTNLLNNYKELIHLDMNFTQEKLFKNITFLTNQEKESIFNFFKGLGRMDANNQSEVIGVFLNTTTNYYEVSKDESNKYSGLYTKLGVIFGAFVALLIV